MPHCLSAIDWKHVAIENSVNGGSAFNYKFFSIILMRLVDANYKIVNVNSQRGQCQWFERSHKERTYVLARSWSISQWCIKHALLHHRWWHFTPKTWLTPEGCWPSQSASTTTESLGPGEWWRMPLVCQCKFFRCILKTHEVISHHGLGNRVSRDGVIVPGTWRWGPTLFGSQHLSGGNFSTDEAKLMTDTLLHYRPMSPAWEVKWQHHALMQKL